MLQLRSPWLGTVGLLTLLAVAVLVRAEENPPIDKRIQDLERQIEALNRQLSELKKSLVSSTAPPAPVGALPEAWVKTLTWRCIGPAAMGGRIVALAVNEADPCTYWVATASGGLLKTTNNGITFEHQFDKETTVSIGDVCVAPSDPNIVWVGTGENNPRNSVSYGDGVYKSTDGGKTWKNMGLQKTFQIGKILIHPKDTNIVYVGALGRLYGPNPERGLFKTTDGGQTWQRVLYVDDKTGVIDMRMHPNDPETLLVATWERQRDEFDSWPGNEVPRADGYDGYDPIKKWGPGSGIFKTTDGGKTFRKITKGLPTSHLGRIGLDWYRKDPNIVFAIVDCAKIGMGRVPAYLGVQGETIAEGVKLSEVTANSPAARAGLKSGDVVVAIDKKPLKTYEELGTALGDKKPGDKVVLEILRGNEKKEKLEITVTLGRRPTEEGGGGFGGLRLLGFLGEPAQKGGLVVRRVLEDSAADKAGLQEGDIVTAIDKTDLNDMQQLLELVRQKEEGTKLIVYFQRGGETRDTTLTLSAPESQLGPSRNRPYGYMYGGQAPNVQDRQGPDGHEYGGVYRSSDGGESWTRINSLNPRPMYFSQVRVDPSDEKFIYVCGVSLHRSKDGGKTFSADGGNGVHPDHHALWINPKDGRHMILGCDGGVYVTYDRMAHWDFLCYFAIGQFYHCCVDSRRPYRVYGGLQDNGTWGGPSHSLNGSGPINEDWIVISGGDGFVCRVDPNDPDLVYYESQDGNMGRRNLRTGERASIRPRRERGQPAPRFNWNTPFILSAHNPKIFYCAGNFVYRCLNQGTNLKPISPEITRTKRGSATALAESPRNPDVLWVGTDDGALWVTRDGGKVWTNVADNVGLPGPRWVSTIEASRFAEGRCYVCFDAHRSDDDNPYVYVTEDFGQTWKSLRANLPWGSTRTLREDILNPELLFLGTEFAAWASLNRGTSWTKINNNLPTVAIHEFAIHPTAGEIVAATHGRSLWVLDITPLRQMTKEALAAKAFLYQPNTAVQWRSEPERGSPYGIGSRKYFGQNPPSGAQIYYSLTQKPQKITLKVIDYAGNTVRELQPASDPGLHRISWNLTRQVQRSSGSRSTPPMTLPPTIPGGGGRGFGMGGVPISPGMYRVVLGVDGQEQTTTLQVEADPTRATRLIASDQEEDGFNRWPKP